MLYCMFIIDFYTSYTWNNTFGILARIFSFSCCFSSSAGLSCRTTAQFEKHWRVAGPLLCCPLLVPTSWDLSQLPLWRRWINAKKRRVGMGRRMTRRWLNPINLSAVDNIRWAVQASLTPLWLAGKEQWSAQTQQRPGGWEASPIYFWGAISRALQHSTGGAGYLLPVREGLSHSDKWFMKPVTL